MRPMLKRWVLAVVVMLSSLCAAQAPDVVGDWLGAIDTGGIKLRVAFHIKSTPEGLAATMDSLDQNARGIPVTAVVRDGASLKLEMKQLNGGFQGKISADGATMEGTWTQGPSSFPLLLKRVKDPSELERRRPQNPAKPYPYREEDVTYRNPAASIILAGTLTVPQGKGPFPAALLITGSGPQDRDEAIMGHKPFLVLADYLTRRGIVVLRVDDRGVGKSGGTFISATTADFATDAEAGVAYLKSRADLIDPKRIGLIGHSEGGLIAPMVAARNADVAFIVLLAGSGVPGDQLLVAQVEALNAASGRSPEDVEKAGATERDVLDLVKGEPDNRALAAKLRERFAGKIPEGRLNSEIQNLTSPWFRYFLTYDPAVALRKVKCSVLALNGARDTQVPPKANLPAIRAALEGGGNKNFETAELPGLNHLLQTAKTGLPTEYGDLEETMSPVALDKIATWIQKQEHVALAAAQ